MVDGIYRHSGVSSNIQKLRSASSYRSYLNAVCKDYPRLKIVFEVDSRLWTSKTILEIEVFKFFCFCFQSHEFDSEIVPDLTKGIYMQDIHCVASLGKLYFRELPNPLLTYQLYDKFAVSTAHSRTQ